MVLATDYQNAVLIYRKSQGETKWTETSLDEYLYPFKFSIVPVEIESLNFCDVGSFRLLIKSPESIEALVAEVAQGHTLLWCIETGLIIFPLIFFDAVHLALTSQFVLSIVLRLLIGTHHLDNFCHASLHLDGLDAADHINEATSEDGAEGEILPLDFERGSLL
jgi:hypothetical protein